MNAQRRAWCAALAGWAWWGSGAVRARPAARGEPVAVPGHLPMPVSLPALTQAAAARGEPAVLLVSLTGCPYCETARSSYLRPLAHEHGAVVAEIDMEADRALEDFGPRASTQAAVARRLRVRLAPTVLFLGASGRELAPRLEGLAVPDFYGAYLEERWRDARAAVRAGRRS